MPLNVLPTMIGSPPSGSRAPRWMFDSVPGAPAVPPLRAEHDEVQRVHRLHLLPRLAAPARRVGRVERLDHDALVPGGQRLRRAARRPRRRTGAARRASGAAPTAALAAPPAARDSGSSIRSTPSRCRQSKKNGRSSSSRRVVGVAPNRLVVSWNGRGRPSSCSARVSPSSTTRAARQRRGPARPARARASVTSRSVRVHTRTTSPSRCTWMRAPSSLYSTLTSAPELGERGVQGLGGARQHRPDRAADLAAPPPPAPRRRR